MGSNPSNRISLDIPPADLQAVMEAIRTIQEKLLPHLVDLDAEQRRAMPKMGPKTLDFVSTALSCMRANPQLKPGFVDLDEFSRDLAAIAMLRQVQQPLDHIADMVGDSVLLCGSEAYAAALACYKSVKAAAKLRQTGAAVLADDLSARWPGRRPTVAKGRASGNAPPGGPGAA